MHRNLSLLVTMALYALAFGNVLVADPAAPNPNESKLRDALRTTMLQLRDAQAQIVAAQAAQADSDKAKADLSARIDALTAQLKTESDQAAADKANAQVTLANLKQSNTDLVTQMVDSLSIQINSLSKPSPNDKAVLDKAILALKTQNPDLTRQLDQYNTDIQLWTAGYNQYVTFSNKTEADRQKLAAQVIVLQRLVADREAKNLELYKTGTEILDRYEKFSLGDALAAKEPFVGVSRVKLQTLVQGYKDKLVDQRVTIGQPPANLSTAPQSEAAKSTAPVTTAKK